MTPDDSRDDGSRNAAGDGNEESTPEWPVDLAGVTESVVSTLGPNDRWNLAALGIHGPAATADGESESDSAVTARTWGRTRTRRNFEARGEGYVQFTRDPVDFTEAALTVREEDDPVLASADAWVRASVEQSSSGRDEGTEWVDWALEPLEVGVERRVVPRTNRGYNAVVEATVAASRLDVDAYDDDRLRERLRYFSDVVDRCGSERDRAACDLIREITDEEW